MQTDYDCIASEKLRSSPMEYSDGETVTSILEIGEVFAKSPFFKRSSGGYLPRMYRVVVEYRSKEEAIVGDSFREYLDSYEEARITQEDMTERIRDDVLDKIDGENLHVSVIREGEVVKRTSSGGLE